MGRRKVSEPRNHKFRSWNAIWNRVRAWNERDIPTLNPIPILFPQQRKLKGSSAQNSSGVHWCRRRVRFNQVPEKAPKVPEKVWEALVQRQVTFNRVPFRRRFRRRSGRLWCRARSGSTGFRRRFRRRSGRLWCRARSGRFRRRFRRRFREALVQSQVRFSRVLEKVPEKVWEALVRSQVRFNRICGHLTHGNPAEVFPALGFAARFKKICKNKTLRLLGIPPKLIVLYNTCEISNGASNNQGHSEVQQLSSGSRVLTDWKNLGPESWWIWGPLPSGKLT